MNKFVILISLLMVSLISNTIFAAKKIYWKRNTENIQTIIPKNSGTTDPTEIALDFMSKNYTIIG